MVSIKKKSRRQSMHLKYHIKKRVSAHNKRQRKEAKKKPSKRKKIYKDLRVPNNFPYKNSILEEIEEKNHLKSKNQNKKKYPENLSFCQQETPFESEKVSEYKSDHNEYHESSETHEEIESWYGFSDESHNQEISCIKKENSLKAFNRLFRDVIDLSDVVLYILDARDPQGTRSQQIEKLVLENHEKTLVFILNKIDLVPYTILMEWISYLSTLFPCLPMRASTSFSSYSFNHSSLTFQSTVSNLVKFLKSHSHKQDIKRSISVGVVGYPNVGKSSIINALVSSLSGCGKKKPCITGSEASTTRSIKQVKLDNKIKLIDSPGIVFPSKNTAWEKAHNLKAYEEAKLVLINAIPPSNIIDPIYTVSQILHRLHSDPVLYKELEKFYNLPPILSTHNDIVTDFLIHIARKKGRLGKSGIPQLESAAKAVINDWCSGRIRWWTKVPKKDKTNSISTNDISTMEDPIIVTEWAKEFNLDEQSTEDIQMEM
ncbi:hypothetical protein PCANB_000794 [Pneumocystis canis]|nr:hypothetical protein PCANB_000794 [Pneumocystis canis]